MRRVYGVGDISERHRHRYEVNPDYFDRIEEAGLLITGRSPDGLLAEMVELPSHPYFVGCQFHPEFKSKPLAPHPLFVAFVRAGLAHKGRRVRGAEDVEDAVIAQAMAMAGEEVAGAEA